jgi:hypothetical protein
MQRPELARNTVARPTVERCEVWVSSKALGLESRIEICATEVQRGPRRTVPVNENKPRVGPPVSIKTTSPAQAMKPAAETVAAQRLISHDYISGVVSSRFSFRPKRETDLTHVLRKVNSSSITRIDDIEGGPWGGKCLAGP